MYYAIKYKYPATGPSIYAAIYFNWETSSSNFYLTLPGAALTSKLNVKANAGNSFLATKLVYQYVFDIFINEHHF